LLKGNQKRKAIRQVVADPACGVKQVQIDKNTRKILRLKNSAKMFVQLVRERDVNYRRQRRRHLQESENVVGDGDVQTLQSHLYLARDMPTTSHNSLRNVELDNLALQFTHLTVQIPENVHR
jgi:hypothetical protein